MAWRRKRRSIFDLFDIEDLFREIEESFKVFEEEIERLLKEAGKGEAMTVGPYFYGVRITVGPDGVPKIEEFGNIRRIEGGKRVLSEEIEPLVDVFEDKDEVWIIVELPGVEKDKIKVKAEPTKVIVKASNSKKYYKEIELPAEVDPKSAKAQYRNGVLEIRLKKKGSSKEEESTEVTVE